ncbi:hypothetical protein BDR26DRAFT_866291 [Obelidium mucronatum]|nr:hypothetical protein BDR26DRAFT_866291 [Obelidium mucronatum]
MSANVSLDIEMIGPKDLNCDEQQTDADDDEASVDFPDSYLVTDAGSNNTTEPKGCARQAKSEENLIEVISTAPFSGTEDILGPNPELIRRLRNHVVSNADSCGFLLETTLDALFPNPIPNPDESEYEKLDSVTQPIDILFFLIPVVKLDALADFLDDDNTRVMKVDSESGNIEQVIENVRVGLREWGLIGGTSSSLKEILIALGTGGHDLCVLLSHELQLDLLTVQDPDRLEITKYIQKSYAMEATMCESPVSEYSPHAVSESPNLPLHMQLSLSDETPVLKQVNESSPDLDMDIEIDLLEHSRDVIRAELIREITELSNSMTTDYGIPSSNETLQDLNLIHGCAAGDAPMNIPQVGILEDSPRNLQLPARPRPPSHFLASLIIITVLTIVWFYCC